MNKSVDNMDNSTPVMDAQVTIADASMAHVKVELENRSLWSEFFQCGTEMILTKPGRRLFPDLKFKISGLDPNVYYFVLLDIIPADEYRYKFMGKCWMPAYKSDSPQHKQNLYIHPDSPALGSKWSSKTIGFNKLKLTNGKTTSDSHIALNSMHKYIPRLHVYAGSDIARLSPRKFTTFWFPETTFMAVTAYQNESVTNLKIKNNPFAKGFREDDRRHPIKRICLEDSEVSAPSSKRRPQSTSPEITTTLLSDTPSPSLPRNVLPCSHLSPSVSSASPTYDFSNEAAKMAPPTYIDFLSTYESMLSLHPFYTFQNRFLPQQTPSLPFVGSFNPQLSYPML